MNALYPLKFKPQYKERIWGGKNLASLFRKSLPEGATIGESWELSTIEESSSIIQNGYLQDNDLQEIIPLYMGDLMGDQVYERFGDELPLLFKWIDAEDVLSVQVHPDDETAKKRHAAYGKNEMWYIIDAQKDSILYNGFNRDVSRAEFLQRLEDGNLEDVLLEVPVQAGDVFYIPAGRIHAIGKGIVLAEIQQSSDVTYRVYDWNRKDASGNARELHLELALDVIDYQKNKNTHSNYTPNWNKSVQVVKSPSFVTHFIQCNQAIERNYHFLDSFVVYFCLNGELSVECEGESYPLAAGECMLIPAEIKELKLHPNGEAKLLEVYIPELV